MSVHKCLIYIEIVMVPLTCNLLQLPAVERKINSVSPVILFVYQRTRLLFSVSKGDPRRCKKHVFLLNIR